MSVLGEPVETANIVTLIAISAKRLDFTVEEARSLGQTMYADEQVTLSGNYSSRMNPRNHGCHHNCPTVRSSRHWPLYRSQQPPSEAFDLDHNRRRNPG